MDIGDAGNTRQRVIQINESVVGQKRGIIAIAGGTKRDQHQRSGKRFLYAHPLRHDLGWQLRRSLRLAHLGQDLVGLRVGRLVKVHPQLHLPAVRVEGIHVIHVVDTADLLFDRSRHRLFDGHGIGSWISRGDNNFGRRNIRKERDG